MNKLKRNLKIFFLFSKYSLKTTLQARLGIVVFILGKIIRFVTLFFFIYLIFIRSKGFQGYNLNQALIIYMTFNIIDTTSQILFREVYRFRPLIISGRFDLVLTRPYHPFLQILVGGIDFMDTFLLLPYFAITIFLVTRGGYFHLINLLAYLFYLMVGLLMATAFHIFVLAFGIMTTVVDHTILIYRDLTAVGRFPVEIYQEPIRFFFTFIFPIALMTNVPAQILMGKNQSHVFVYGLIFAAGLLLLSLWVWKIALKRYQSYGG